jgi:hypothetical protein
MSGQSRKEYLEAIQIRYKSAVKEEKEKILDEFCSNCGYNRKYAIRLLNAKTKRKNQKKKSGRKKKYHNEEILTFIKTLWRSTNLICSKRLKTAIPLWLPYYEGELSEKNRKLLLEISAATIDRLLEPIRKKTRKMGLATTKPGSLIKKQVPIKTNQWDETKPGFIEADTVAHCGNTVAGQFAYTVNTVDIATGWIESRAIWGKGQKGCFEAIRSIEKTLPFKILGFDSDNGGEFLNWHLLSYFTKRKQPVKYTRSRSYQKNDNAHIEGKNWTHIRQYLGYMRFDDPTIVDFMNDLYENEWSYYFNFFIPSVKLISKERVEAKQKKIYDKPKTPFHRLIESEALTSEKKKELTRISETMNPFKLQKVLEMKIKNILRYVNER